MLICLKVVQLISTIYEIFLKINYTVGQSDYVVICLSILL